MEAFHKWLFRYFPPYRWLVMFLRKVPFPGNKKRNMAQVLGFFLMKLPDESITTKASAIAFNFFIALIPAFIVLFSLIPYIPIDNLKDEIMAFIEQAIPQYAFQTINSTLTDVLEVKRGGLLSITFVITIYFASNGFSALLAALDPSGSFWEQKLKSFGLMFLVSLLVVVAVTVSILSEVVYTFFEERISQFSGFENAGLSILKWLILISLTYVSVALMYYAGTPKAKRLSFFSPGASLSTITILLISYGYGYYVENFAQYNRFYGSLGALVFTLLWMYFCALILMIWHVYNESHARFK